MQQTAVPKLHRTIYSIAWSPAPERETPTSTLTNTPVAHCPGQSSVLQDRPPELPVGRKSELKQPCHLSSHLKHNNYGKKSKPQNNKQPHSSTYTRGALLWLAHQLMMEVVWFNKKQYLKTSQHSCLNRISSSCVELLILNSNIYTTCHNIGEVSKLWVISFLDVNTFRQQCWSWFSQDDTEFITSSSICFRYNLKST